MRDMILLPVLRESWGRMAGRKYGGVISDEDHGVVFGMVLELGLILL